MFLHAFGRGVTEFTLFQLIISIICCHEKTDKIDNVVISYGTTHKITQSHNHG